jgi:hypothetical protein
MNSTPSTPSPAGRQESEDAPPFLRFDPEALEAFTDWRCSFEAGLRSGDLFPALESHLAKYRKLVPALALVFHLADGHGGPVGFPSTLRALHWAVYLESHARRCYGVAQAGEADTARRILERIAKGDLPREGFGTRDVWRPGGRAWPIKSRWPPAWICWRSWGTSKPGRSRPAPSRERSTS